MRDSPFKVLLYVVLIALALTVNPTQAMHRGNSTVVNLCASDGTAGQPSGGSTPFPSLLVGYVAPSTCTVYGVNGKVGADATTATVDPSTLTVAPYSYDAVNHLVRCDDNGSQPPDIRNINFALHGGTGFLDRCFSGTGVHIYNSIWTSSTNCSTNINFDTVGINIDVENSTFDGGGLTNVANCGGTNSEAFIAAGSGTVTTHYNLVKNWPQHFILLECAANCTNDEKYNLVYDMGWGQGPHADMLFIENASPGVTITGAVAFNTALNQQPTVNMVETPTGTFINANNTFTTTGLPSITNANDNSLLKGSPITGSKIPGGTTIVSATTTGGPVPAAVSTSIVMSQNASSGGSATFAVQNAYASTGIPGFFISQGGGTIDGLVIEHNTFIAQGGSIQTASTMIYCGTKEADFTSVFSNMHLINNYLDISGAVDAFAGGTGHTTCRSGINGSVVSGNINMSTGGTIVAS